MTQLPAHLQNRQNRRQIAEHVHDGLGTGSMPSVSIKGNQFTLVDSGGDTIPIDMWLDCVIIDTNAGVSRVFWGLDPSGQPMAFSEGNMLPPVCFSDNGIGASTQATEPQSASCRQCPMSQFNWPSKIDPSKRTSACRPTKKIAVLAFEKGATGQDGVYQGAVVTAGEADDAPAIPFAMRIPVTSHENLRTYSNKFVNQPFDVSDVVTRIKFVHGQVGQLDFDAVGFIDGDTDSEINEILAEKKTDALIGRGDQPIQGAIPAPAARPLAAPSAAAPSTGTAPVSTPTATPAPAASPFDNAPAAPAKAGRGRPRKTKAEPAQASPAPFAAPQQEQAPVAPFARPQTNGPAPNHGIVSNAPAPTGEMEKTLDSLFSLPT